MTGALYMYKELFRSSLSLRMMRGNLHIDRNQTNISSSVHVQITGCPEGWTAGPAGCYQLSTGYVTNRDFAVKRCALRGGHLVTIENEAENHFLSHAFANATNGNERFIEIQKTMLSRTENGHHVIF